MTFNKWLNQLLNRNAYLMQAYLPLSNKEEQPFDIRALLQKIRMKNGKSLKKEFVLEKKERLFLT